MTADSGWSVGKKCVSRLLGLGGRGRLDWTACLLGGHVEREIGAREGNVETTGRHCARLVVVLLMWGERRVSEATRLLYGML